MKKTTLLLFFLPVVILLNACSKNYNETLPTVSFTSVTPYGNDSALITGTVTSAGTSGVIDYVGFSYSSQPSFDILSNQILLNGTTGQFSYVMQAKQDSTYYFKCFAANDNGYGVSNVFKYTVPVSKGDSASCGLAENTVIDNSNSYPMTYVYSGASYAPYGSFGVQASNSSGNEVLTIQFKMVPQNGLYTTQADIPTFQSDNNPYEVNVSVMQGSFSSYTINSGGTVYVAKYPNGSVTVSFCSLTYSAFSTNFSISAKVNY